MSKKDPIEKSVYINNQYKEYLRSSFEFGNGKLQPLFEEDLDKEDLFKGPYVALNLPFQRGKNLDSLIAEGIVCESFRQLGDMNFSRPLYAHQEDSIRHICSGHSAIVTTGTGSGKTECFLYPILNELLQDIENGNHDIGVRAIFLYPMNALVNDQIERVRKILTPYPEITYGFFTGETKETVPKNYREKYGTENDTFIPENELVSREEIRNTPPHFLFTNYSMLEYLMIRPNDYAIFTPERLRNCKFVVLDEAHTYKGSLGIEISLLLRRLTGLAEKKPRFILTSATLGKQGKSEQAIVNFAKNLTSVPFERQDIIFSKRIPLRADQVRYEVSGEDYISLLDAGKDIKRINAITVRYINVQSPNYREALFDLLIHDNNVFHIFTELKEGSKTFQALLNTFENGITARQLMALIDLINVSEKDGLGIFDLKYHSFVRPLNGAYITLGDDTKLSLTKTNMLNGLKAFEIGNCRYCNTPYIIGKIQRNNADGLDYLYQNKEVDIYENYGNNQFVSLDFFALDDITDDENNSGEDADFGDVLEEYDVCAKCGAIHPAQNLNARTCECGDSYHHIIYRVSRSKKSKEETVWNNITRCPCCGHRSRSGVIKSLNLGKDEGTALIGQILYESLDEGEQTIQRKGKLSLKPGINKQISIAQDQEKVKQFLAFSDSRQQASFAAVFLNSNHVRMMRKRLIWKVIEDQNYRSISVDEMASYLTEIIRERDLFDNELNPHKNAWATIMVDLLKIDGSYDGEGMGLYYFDLDLSDILDQIDEEDVKESFGKYNVTKNDFATMMQVVFDVFKITPAINYVKSTLTPDEKMEVLGYRRFDNYVMYNCPRTIQGIRSFLPVKSKDNMVVRYIKKVCGCDDEEAKDILDVLFNNLAVAGGIFRKHPSKEAYQIDAGRYIIKNYKNSKFYKCSKCGRLTPYNVHNKCVQDRCDGTLVEVDPDEVLAGNYYRQQYKHKKIERIVIKEHTAQLDRKKAKEYQRDFKNKKINILSCSTTFEMGIDIGNLETVFMRNIPPSPANYVQRAGRAGRRKDSSAYIITYCGTGSHDYTYFCEPEKMISGVINPPYFDVFNHKIIVRHLMAASLGYFFRKYPEYFGSIDGLVFGDGIDRFNSYIQSRPDDLKQYIDKHVLPGESYSDYHDFNWFKEMDYRDEKLTHFAESIRAIAKEYNQAKEEALNDEKYGEADYYTHQIENLHNERVIDALSKYCVIPKYGFPVDVVELQIYKDGKLNNDYETSRDLKIAISEYAPDSEIIVDGKKYTSKYITLPKTGQYPRHYFNTCSNCGRVNIFLSERTGNTCKYCGESLDGVRSEFYIEPTNGFKTGKTKESTHIRPKRSYAGEVLYLGGGNKDEEYLQIGKAITVETTSNDELLVVNKSNFYTCPVCGYSDIARKKVITPTTVKKHKNYRLFDCECDELQLIKIGHSFQTDVARMIIPSLSAYAKEDYSRALSFMYALLEGISIALDIDRNDIDGILELNMERGSYDILIYDNVPGGAGHVKRLINRDSFVKALMSAHEKVSQHCCDENTSCYNCLRNYYNQSYHNKLVRKYAKDFTEMLIREIG